MFDGVDGDSLVPIGLSGEATSGSARRRIDYVPLLGDRRRCQPIRQLTPTGSSSGTPLGVAEPTARIAEDRAQAFERVRADTLARLRALAAQCLSGVEFETHARSSDHTAEAIIGEATRLQADAIAMGTHGRTGFRRALLGSVAESVIRTSTVPVFFMRQGMRTG